MSPNSVALQFLSSSQSGGTDIPETAVAEYISRYENFQQYETADSVHIFTMKEYADIFKRDRNITGENIDCTDELVQDFVEQLNIVQTQGDTICSKTVHQGGGQFWTDQRSGRMTASNFYKFCHLKETTNVTDIIKLLMNYCPMKNIPEVLE